eukprot:TRINITY_DN7244_c7_g1_i1.p1 TRINITY_DN7244_c7_g1~~TRINITY_DN7244_c7_g1_i1.p1  ORF type:complete len:1012 (+),score=253.83 TRINITY_DN7244_c7_g1_i1:158-3037(+)
MKKLMALCQPERKASYSKITVVSPSEQLVEPQMSPRRRSLKSNKSEDDATLGQLYRSGRANSISMSPPTPAIGRSDGNIEDLLRISSELATAPVTSLVQVAVTIAKKTSWLMNCDKTVLWIRNGSKLTAYVDRHSLCTNSLNPLVEKEKTIITKDLCSRDPEGACIGNMTAIYCNLKGEYTPKDVVAASPAVEDDIRTSMWMPIIHEGEVFACIKVSNKRGTKNVGLIDFTVEDESLLGSLNLFVVTIIKNSLLYQDLNTSYTHSAELLDLVRTLSTTELDLERLCNHIMYSAKRLLCADRCSLFVVDKPAAQLVANMDGHSKEVRIPFTSGIAGHVASTGTVCNIDDAYADKRFNRQMDKQTGYKTNTILCAPITYDNNVLAVAQLVNKDTGPFTKEDEETFAGFSTFAGISIQNTMLHSQMVREKRTITAVLATVTHLNKLDIMQTDVICKQIMEQAKDLVKCERCALFMVDKEHNQLYSTVANQTGGEIRFTMSQGIAGHVARTGEIQNIPDAYADERFNIEVDKKTGFVTRNILCMPVVFGKEVIAVTQLVNKMGSDAFNTDDEKTLQVFSEFAAMSLRNAQLFEFMKAAELETKTLLEMSSKPNMKGKVMTKTLKPANRISELKAMDLTPEETNTLLGVGFNIHKYNINDNVMHRRLVRLAGEIFETMGVMSTFSIEEDTLYSFLCAVQSKYRSVPYHNFTHAFDVMQTLATWIAVYDVKRYLTSLDILTLLISGLCHDLDHMGLNNSFLLTVETPLGVLSASSGSKSVLEVHHCNIAIDILQDETCDILQNCTEAELKEVWKSLIESILSTDMAKHAELSSAFAQQSAHYNEKDTDHKRLLLGMLLKAADVSNITKPFEISRAWGQYVTAEFDWQGAQEQEAMLDVKPMFDRQNKSQLAAGQLLFIQNVGLPLFSTLTKFLPSMSPVLDQLKQNRNQWQGIVDTQQLRNDKCL